MFNIVMVGIRRAPAGSQYIIFILSSDPVALKHHSVPPEAPKDRLGYTVKPEAGNSFTVQADSGGATSHS